MTTPTVRESLEILAKMTERGQVNGAFIAGALRTLAARSAPEPAGPAPASAPLAGVLEKARAALLPLAALAARALPEGSEDRSMSGVTVGDCRRAAAALIALRAYKPEPLPEAVRAVVEKLRAGAVGNRHWMQKATDQEERLEWRNRARWCDDLADRLAESVTGGAEEGAGALLVALRGALPTLERAAELPIPSEEPGIAITDEEDPETVHILAARRALAAARSALSGAAASGEGAQRLPPFEIVAHDPISAGRFGLPETYQLLIDGRPVDAAFELHRDDFEHTTRLKVRPAPPPPAQPARGNAPRSDEEAPGGSGGRAEGGSGRSGAPTYPNCGARRPDGAGGTLYCTSPVGHEGPHDDYLRGQQWA